jgi:hypothetical protein
MRHRHGGDLLPRLASDEAGFYLAMYESCYASVRPFLSSSSSLHAHISTSVSEMATVVIVGCFPSFPRLFHYMRGQNRDSRQKSYESQNSEQQRYAKDKLGSMAKYMGPGGTTSVSNEHLELHTYDCELGSVGGTNGKGEETRMNGILKTTRVEQSVIEDEVVR